MYIKKDTYVINLNHVKSWHKQIDLPNKILNIEFYIEINNKIIISFESIEALNETFEYIVELLRNPAPYGAHPDYLLDIDKWLPKWLQGVDKVIYYSNR
jgi:hypothetical protein